MSNVITPSQSKTTSDPLIVRLLRSITQLDSERLNDLYNSPTKNEDSFEEMVIRSGIADERQIAQAYANHYLLPFFDPPLDTPPPVDPEIAKVLPSRLCHDHLIAPLSDDGQTIEVAVFSPDSLLLADEVRLITGRQMRPLFTSLSVIERLLSILYQDGSWTNGVTSSTQASFDEMHEPQELVGEEFTVTAAAIPAEIECAEIESTEIVHLSQAPPPGTNGRVIRYVNSLFSQALRSKASDIHIEPYGRSCRVRFRIDGSLTEIAPPAMQLLNSVVSRLKVLAKMDIAEMHLPQDGVIGLRCGDHRVDVRVNTCPTVEGEKVVMRLLDKRAFSHDLASLGLDERQFRDLSEAIRSSQGLMFVTGPAGVGKSTTLYSCLNLLNDSKTNICTVEDPVEFKFGGINQVQTQAKRGLTCSTAVQSLLRQDPDVIMVGEVRDNETAVACMRAALAGRFVFSALHTNNALSSITRLKDMGGDPFVLASTLRLLSAQRLLRRLCNDCKVPGQLVPESAKRYCIDPNALVFVPRGCNRCRETGYRGRLAVFEIIRINAKLSAMIQAGESIDRMQHAAVADGMKLLQQSAIEKVVSGDTSLDEAISVCGR